MCWSDVKWIFTDKRILPEECYRTPLEWRVIEIHEALRRWSRVVDHYPRGPRGSPQNYTRVKVAREALKDYNFFNQCPIGSLWDRRWGPFGPRRR